jgi:hypothetical protein
MDIKGQDELDKDKDVKVEAKEETKVEEKKDLLSTLKSRIKAEIETKKSSGMLLTDVMLIALLSKEFTLEEIYKFDEVHACLGMHGFERALEVAENRYEKWYLKYGKGLSENAQRKCLRAQLVYALIEQSIRPILDLYGVTGPMRAMYRAYAFAITKVLTKNNPRGWLIPVMKRYNEWKTRQEIDEKILKCITWITLKAYAYYLDKVST